MNEDKLIRLEAAIADLRTSAERVRLLSSDPHLATVVQLVTEMAIKTLEAQPEVKA